MDVSTDLRPVNEMLLTQINLERIVTLNHTLSNNLICSASTSMSGSKFHTI